MPALHDNLISYYQLNEASGDALDSHGSNNLTDTNTVGSAAGLVGNARDFELGNTERFTHTDNADFSVGDIAFTFAGWFKLESTAQFMGLLGKSTDSTNREYLLYFDPPNNNSLRASVTHDGSTNSNIAIGLSLLTTGVWYYGLFQHDPVNNTLRVIVNDNWSDVPASHSTGVFNGTGNFYLGSVHGAGTLLDFDGLLDEWGYWKRLLTKSEITFLYNNGAGRAYADLATFNPTSLKANLVSYWEMNESSGNALDSHGSNPLSPSSAIGTAAGKVGSARDLTGSQEFSISSNASLVVRHQDFTFAGWIYYDSVSGVRWFASKYQPGTGAGWTLAKADSAGTGKLAFEIGSAFGVRAGIEASVPTTSTWYFVRAWLDVSAATVNIQINNGTVFSNSIGAVRNTDEGPLLEIGALTGFGLLDGRVDECGYWKRVLTTAEATYLYNSGNGRSYADLALFSPDITTTTLPDAPISSSYSETLAVTGGVGSITWTIVSGALPAGLTLNSSTGEISGTASAEESASFTVRATDSNGNYDEQALTLDVTSPFGAFEVMNMVGLRLEGISWGGAVLRVEFGPDGLGAQARVGSEGGVHGWSMHSAGIWLDELGMLTVGGVSRFEWHWEFFKRHTTGDTDIFVVEWRDEFYHASFKDTEITVDKFKNALIYEGGVEVKQRRITGGTYNANGSIDLS